MKLDPRDADALRNLANILNGRGDLAAAMAHYRSAIAVRSGDSDARLGLAEAMIKSGDGRAAIETLDEVLAAHASDTRTLSLKCAALAEHVATHPSLREDVTTVHGFDTDEILADEKPAVATLRRFIQQMARRFMADMGVDSSHPFAQGRPQNYRFKCWGVRMWRQGYQVPHIHHNAWLSGVYYVRLPKVVAEEGSEKDGWIEFGRGEDALFRHAEPQLSQVRPEEGLMLTFPSYFWHRTIPVAGADDRISIAFDLIPTD